MKTTFLIASCALALATPALHAGHILFVGFDLSPGSTTNSDAARNAFLAHMNGAATESLESLNPPDWAFISSGIPMTFNGFTGDLGGSRLSPLTGTGAFAPIGGGNNFFKNEPSGWGIDFSKPIVALGFSLNNVGAMHAPGDPLTENRFVLSLGLIDIVISPYDYGLVGGDSIDWGFVGVISDTAFTGAGFRHEETTFTRNFSTDLFIAADETQVVPEPGTWASIASGLGLIVLGRHRRRIR